MKAWVLTILSFVAAPSFASQMHYTDKQVIDYAKSIDVHTLDPSLASQRLEEWLRSGTPHANVRWDVSDTCDNKPFRREEFPLCAKIWFSRNGEAGSFLIQVGTNHKGIQGQPHLYNPILSWEDGTWILSGDAERLSELPKLIDQAAYAHVVGLLYDEVILRHPLGIPSDPTMTTIKPFLSKRLVDQLEAARACEADYLGRIHPASENGNPAWLKSDLFSGGGNRLAPASAWPVREGQQKDGSFQVLVNLFGQAIDVGNGLKGGLDSPAGTWHVYVRVIPENGHFVVDDVRLFDGSSTDGPSHLLSESFTGCEGSRWVGLAAAEQ